jgi:hypothetical protein
MCISDFAISIKSDEDPIVFAAVAAADNDRMATREIADLVLARPLPAFTLVFIVIADSPLRVGPDPKGL